MKKLTVHDAILMGWKIFQFNFTDGSHEIIASFISTDVHALATTRLVENDTLTEYIEDDWVSFSYAQFFKRKIDGLIQDVTQQYLTY